MHGGGLPSCKCESSESSGRFYFCELSNTQHNLGQHFRNVQIISLTCLWNCHQAPHS